jgi:hypothetical protein
MSISKIELKKHLQKMGISVQGNYVKKSDIKRIIKAEKESLVIQNKNGEFWAGSFWSDEYPEAKLFDSVLKAKQELKKTKEGMIIRNYGYDNQEEVK